MLETTIVLVMTILDQLVKLWAQGPLRNLHGGDLPLIEGVFHFTYAENRGAAFGMLQDARVYFIVVTIIAVVALTVYIVKKRRTMGLFLRVALSLIIAGALGNLIDRVILGYVRDMFYFKLINFAIFNVADACVTVGGAMVVLYLIADEFKQSKKAKELKETEGGKESESEGEKSPPDSQAAKGNGETEPEDAPGTQPQALVVAADIASNEGSVPELGAAEGNHAD